MFMSFLMTALYVAPSSTPRAQIIDKNTVECPNQKKSYEVAKAIEVHAHRRFKVKRTHVEIAIIRLRNHLRSLSRVGYDVNRAD